MTQVYFSYNNLADHDGRMGVLQTRRGHVSTPFFMPDATRASVRGITRDQILSAGIVPMVVNTYHLMLEPGAPYLEKMGGVHAFMNWDGPLVSDSGGFQVYSLIHKNKDLGKITEEGARFRSVIDGSWHMLTPERAIEIQFQIGSDVMIVLDDPRPPEVSRREHEAAVERTIRWARQCKAFFETEVERRKMSPDTRPLLFAVVQGGPHIDLRQKCARELAEIGFDGYGFGGRHIDDEGVFMADIIESTAAAIPEQAPRFALGIGTPDDIVKCFYRGWDFFDCVIPTREGRHGRAFVMSEGVDLTKSLEGQTFYSTINIQNARFREDISPIDVTCDCYACATYTRAYIRHLFHVGEPLGSQMVALHNMRFFTRLMNMLQQDK